MSDTASGFDPAALPVVDPTQHPKLAKLLQLIKTWGPIIISLLGSSGIHLPPIPGLPGVGAQAAFDAAKAEAALGPLDSAKLDEALAHTRA